jgi:hypothetical protein
MRLACLGGVFVALCAASCQTDPSTPEVADASIDSAAGIDGSTRPKDAGLDSGPCNGIPKSQGPSQPCCLEHRVDACGASLFCAAFDGRTQPTCYADFSRLDQTECNADTQCASQGCNPTTHKCMSGQFAKCTAENGCAPTVVGKNQAFCNTLNSPSTCQEVGDGKGGAACGADADCKSGKCRTSDFRCLSALNARCDWGTCSCPGLCGELCESTGCVTNTCAAGACKVVCEGAGAQPLCR